MSDIEEIEERPVPKVTRRKNKFGQEHGPFTVKVGKKRVDLKTESYIVARERAREAFYDGKIEFQDARFYDETKPEPGTPITPINPVVDWTTDAAGAAASGLKPDLYTPANGTSVPLLSPMPKVEGEEPPPKFTVDGAAEGSSHIPPEMFAGMIDQLAMMLIEGQIQGQEWLFKRFAKMEAGPVPMNNIGRTAGADFWKQQLKKWMPEDVPLPEWAAAMCACAMFTIPAQMAGMRPMQPKATPDFAANVNAAA